MDPSVSSSCSRKAKESVAQKLSSDRTFRVSRPGRVPAGGQALQHQSDEVSPGQKRGRRGNFAFVAQLPAVRRFPLLFLECR